MPPVPVLSGKAVVKAFEKDGWVLARQRGSHMVLVKENHAATLSVSNHKEVAKGRLRTLIRASGMPFHN